MGDTYYSKISNSNQSNTVRQKSTSVVTTTVEDKKVHNLKTKGELQNENR